MEIYQEIFSSWEDVQREYSMNESEPDEVLLAYYSYEDYSGSSVVIFRLGDKFFYQTGGHCSCYGLEGQWGPEEFENKENFVKFLEMLKPYDAADGIRSVIEKLKGE